MVLNDLPLQLNVQKSTNYSNFLSLYENHTFDHVIIDNNHEVSTNLMNYIQADNPKQKMILLNEYYSCKNINDCIRCEQNYNTKVLIKPFRNNQLISSLTQNFKCEQFKITKENFSFEQIKKEIMYEFPFVIYDSETKEFSLEEISNNLKIAALISITDKLTRNNINFNVCNESEIVQVIL